MKATTRDDLRKSLLRFIDDEPRTAGEFMDILRAHGSDVRRHAVKQALEDLLTDGLIMAEITGCRRNGRWVKGAHYFARVITTRRCES